MDNNILYRIAMIIFAAIFIYFGVNHLLAGSAMAGMVPIPGGAFWIYLTGIAQVLAGIAFIINVKVKLAAYLLALYLLIVVLSIHLPETLRGDMMGRTMLVKDLGLMAGALFLATGSGK